MVRGTSMLTISPRAQRLLHVVAALGLGAEHPRCPAAGAWPPPCSRRRKPPPPAQTINASSGPASSISSSAAVPAPAITGRWSKGRISAAPLLGEALRDGGAVFLVAVVDDHLGAVAARGRELERGRVCGITMVAAAAMQLRCQRHRLRVVARGEGDHAALRVRPQSTLTLL